MSKLYGRLLDEVAQYVERWQLSQMSGVRLTGWVHF